MIDEELPSDDQLEQDLIKLAKEQEKLLAELHQAYAEEDEELRNSFNNDRKTKLDAEMEALAKAMSSSASPTEIENAVKQMKEVCAPVPHHSSH